MMKQICKFKTIIHSQKLTTKIWLRLLLAQILEPKLLVHVILKFT